MTINNFFKECHKREVFKLLSIYIVSSWIILQVLSVIWEPLGMSDKSVTYLILILLIGFPIYIYILWKVKVRYAKSSIAEKDIETIIKNEIRFKRMYFSSLGLIAMFSFSIVLVIFNNKFSLNNKIPDFKESDRIAVLKFDNNTGDEKHDNIGKMTLDWIQHGITENKIGQVITQGIVNDYSSAIQTQNKNFSDLDILSTFLKPSKIVSGSFFLNNNNLIFQCSILDVTTNETLISFKPIECNSESPLDCVKELQQKILGYFITDKDEQEINLQQQPPKFEAYQYFTEAVKNYENKELYIELLNKAIASDSSYFVALVQKVLFYWNNKEFKIADSLRLTILPQTGISERQRNLLNHYEALLKGDSKKAYNTLLPEYNLNPFHLRENQSMMVFAHQFVNRPEMVDKIYNEIEMNDFSLENCIFCVYRYYVKAMADISTKKYDSAISLLENAVDRSDHFYLKKALISAYVRTSDFEAHDRLLNKIKLMHTKEEWEESNMLTGKEILMFHENTDLAKTYFDNVIMASEDKNKKNYANAHYYKGDYLKAEELYNSLLIEEPENVNYLSKQAISFFKNGKTNASDTVVKKLNDLRSDYQFGSIDYAIAMIFASQNENDKAIEHLTYAIAAGHRYNPEEFQNDYHFKSIVNTPKFDMIMKFWH